MPKNKKSGNIREAGVHGQCDGWPADARSGGEVSSYSSTSESTTLQRSLFVICLLSQFSILRVRTDFRAGMFDLPEDLTLEEIDLLCTKVLPQWMGLRSLKNGLIFARCNIVRLVTNDDSLMVLTGDFCARTCTGWMKLLYEVGTSDYWDSKNSFLIMDELNEKPTVASTGTVGTNTDKYHTCNVATNTVVHPDCSPPVSTITDTCSAQELSSNCILDMDGMCENTLPIKESKISVDLPVSVISLSSYCDEPPTIISKSANVDERDHSSGALNPEDFGEQQNKTSMVVCNYCHISGHVETSCWRKFKLCLICGGQHHICNCSRFVERNVSSCISCPLCGLQHLGRHCPRRMSPVVKCNWCGKNGHNETICWMRNRCCLVCGDPNHMIMVCPHSKFNRSVRFPPWWTDCYQHLPGD